MTTPSNQATEDEFLTGPSALMALRAIYGSVWNFLFNIVLPFVGFLVLTNWHVGTIAALSIVAIFPLTVTLFTWLRTRRVDTLGALSLIFIAVGIVTGFITGSARFLLVKESVFTGIFGLVFLGSLLRERPLTFYFGRQFATQGDPERRARWDDLWQYPNFRHTQRVMSAVWGLGWLADALIRIGLVFVLSVTVFMVVSQVMFFGVFIATFMWTIAYARRQKREADLAEALRVNSWPPNTTGEDTELSVARYSLVSKQITPVHSINSPRRE